MTRPRLALVGFLLLAVIVVVLALSPKYTVGENICVRTAFAADDNGQVAKGRYRVASIGGGHYGIVPISPNGAAMGGQVQAPAGPLESNSDSLSKTSHTCP